MTFHPESFISSLSYMVSGMLGILAVIGVLVLITVVLNRVTASNASKKDDQ